MGQQSINIGSTANDGTGDTLRDGGDKINDNFTELYTTTIILNDTSVASAANVGTLRYRLDGTRSYFEMCMQDGAASFSWIEIKMNNW
tara:strand:+ start:4378 stop:4641 length:264 start_codon:yes stop_codon:yes gene_type:complete